MPADTILLNTNTSTGATLATDDIGGVHYPRSKLIHGADGTNAGDVANSNPFPVKLIPTTADGLTFTKTISAASTNATSTKASAGQVYGIVATNINAAVRYLKLYNKASAPTVGTDTPVATFAIPGNTAGAGLALNFPQGLAFATGIAWALTTGSADADTAAVAASDLIVHITYK
jgi:hypothetical protein